MAVWLSVWLAGWLAVCLCLSISAFPWWPLQNTNRLIVKNLNNNRVTLHGFDRAGGSSSSSGNNKKGTDASAKSFGVIASIASQLSPEARSCRERGWVVVVVVGTCVPVFHVCNCACVSSVNLLRCVVRACVRA